MEEPGKSSNSAPMLFSGDTLFVGGCGRFFEGTAAQMLHNLDRFAALDPATQVFCAHEYTENNLKFLALLDASTLATYQAVQEQRALGAGTVPTTIGEQLRYNLFMKCHDPKVQKMVCADDAVTALQKLRDLKNNFK
jgi:hydroxyacylglutathione hydrolase